MRYILKKEKSFHRKIVKCGQEPLPGEIICCRDRKRRQSSNVSYRSVRNSNFRFYHLLLRYLLFYYFNCSLQCQSSEVCKGLQGVEFHLLNFLKPLSALSTRSEPRVNSADFEVRENDQIVSEKKLPLVLRA